MLLVGSIKSNKSEILWRRYVELVNGGVSPEKILVLCLNSYKKKIFIDNILENVTVPMGGKVNVSTFYGLCYNAILDNWPVIENSIRQDDSVILPNLCGLQLSQVLLAKSMSGERFKDYFSKTNLLHQMFKRIQLTVLNGLSDAQVAKKSEILGESFFGDAAGVYDDFRKLTLKYRSFDYLRQLSVLPFVQKNTDYFSKIEYLLIDDADEITYSELNFIKSLKPQLKDWIVAYDADGASRCGYLSAYKTAVFEFEKIFDERPEILEVDDVWQKNADITYNNILCKNKTKLSNFEISSAVKRLDMLDLAFKKIKELLNCQVKPSDILIVTPLVDNMFKTAFDIEFADVDMQVLNSSLKPKDNVFLRNVFTVIKLSHKSWGKEVDIQDLRILFNEFLSIPLKYSRNAINVCVEAQTAVDFHFEKEKYQQKYVEFCDFIKNLSEKSLSFSAEILEIFNFLAKNGISKRDLKNFNFFLKEVKSFENAFGNLDEQGRKKVLIVFEKGIISENPSVAEEIEKNSIVVSTPQKVIDCEIKRKYHIWLDVSSDLWTMRDIGVLYNAWVFNADWQNREFTFEDNARLSNEKNARVIRKLMLCCEKSIFAYHSQYDSSGYENFGNLQTFFISDEKPEKNSVAWKIVPREDQKPVVEYNGGRAAVNAVPGAGKTTILIALLVKLLSNGVSPSNVFVLTYMESAAANIREKIKLALPDLTELPNISTIHGLAFRIIKENNHYTKLNLPDNIEVADDNTIQKFLRECIAELNLNQDDYDDFKGGISAVKLSPNGIKPLFLLQNKKYFSKLFDLYEQKLRLAGVIDYDDMLRYSVRLVDENAEIRQYYSDLCHFVIEDEAQDSSELQQKLLNLLSEKHQNLLRIGDINQAITSSFTDSDPKCFKKYFENSVQMVMKTSQRSAVQIQVLANNLIDFSKTQDFLKDTFFESKLTPTGKNPETDKVPSFKVFDNLNEEKFFILNKIKDNIKSGEKSSVAVLLRNNYQIADWAKFLSENGLSVTLRSDILEQKTVFRVIAAFLDYLQTPFSNQCVQRLMKTFNDCKIIKFSDADFDFVKKLEKPFILSDLEGVNECLTRLWWELQFNNDLSYMPLDEAVVRIGLRYFSTQNEKANIFLISTIVKRLAITYSLQETVLEKLWQIAKRPIGSSFKFFDEEDQQNECSVRLMTLHKSKGDEFDVVFIPELSEENYSLTPEKIKIKSTFVEEVKKLRNGYKNRTIDDMKKEIAEETLRLLYVGITRAKKELYISCSNKNKYSKKQTPSVIFSKVGGKNE